MKPECQEKILELRLDQIRLDGGTQSRVDLVTKTIVSYKEADILPPIVVFHDGSHYWLASGFHRYFAHREAKRSTIACRVYIGSVRDAILFSVGCNAIHGLPRTEEDKKHVCKMLLADKEWGKWSDREIARQCKVAHSLVANVRRNLTEPASTASSLDGTSSEDAVSGDGTFGDAVSGDGTFRESPENLSNDKKSACAAPRVYKTKHGTQATMRVENIQKANRRRAVVVTVEEEPGQLAKLDAMIERSRRKYVRQCLRRGLTEDVIVRSVREEIAVYRH